MSLTKTTIEVMFIRVIKKKAHRAVVSFSDEAEREKVLFYDSPFDVEMIAKNKTKQSNWYIAA